MHTVESKAKSPKGNAKQDFSLARFSLCAFGARSSERASVREILAQTRASKGVDLRMRCSRKVFPGKKWGSLPWAFVSLERGPREEILSYLRVRRGVFEMEFCGQFQMTGRESFELILFVGYNDVRFM